MERNSEKGQIPALLTRTSADCLRYEDVCGRPSTYALKHSYTIFNDLPGVNLLLEESEVADVPWWMLKDFRYLLALQ